MTRTSSILLAGGTVVCALGIGYVMQYGLSLPHGDRRAAPVEVTDIQDTAGHTVPAALIGTVAQDATKAAFEPSAAVPALPAAREATRSQGTSRSSEDVSAATSCDTSLTAMPIAGALVRLQLDAPCNAGERVTLHHNGLMVTEVLDDEGALSLDMPALSERAIYIASFGEAEGAVAQTQVSSVPYYDRIVLQWQDTSGLQLHAREWGAAYFNEGHVWRGAAGKLETTVQGKGGFLLHLGHDDTAIPRLAEVYSFPAGMTGESGEIQISVEVEVTEANCGQDVSAQVIELRLGTAPTLRDLSLSIPDCEAVGDYLVLKNLIEDLKIAAN